MTSKYYKEKQFRSAQREWYSKLKAEGFRDIESGFEDTPYLAGLRASSSILDLMSSGSTNAHDAFADACDYLSDVQDMQSSREEVLNLCTGKMNTENWLAMLYCAQGMSERDIAKLLDRSRVWSRPRTILFKDVFRKYFSGSLFSDIKRLLDLDESFL